MSAWSVSGECLAGSSLPKVSDLKFSDMQSMAMGVRNWSYLETCPLRIAFSVT